MKFALVFPGQGSQKLGMMAAYGEHPVIRDTFAEASAALGRDLWQLVSEGPAEALNQTVNTQPLMLTAGIAAYRLWLAQGGPQPAYVAGHSLGEYSALVAAGAIDFADAVPLVELRARAMQEAVPAGEGGMAAILGLDVATVRAACAEAAAGQVVEAVNLNAPEQTVIAGHAAAVQRAADACKAKGAKRAVMLPVSAPFHCALMRPAAEKLKQRLATLTLHAPRIPLVNNVDVAIVDDPERIKDALVRQAAAPVRWVETMQAMAAEGVSHVYECGPGKVLAGLVKRCADDLEGGALADAAGIDAAIATLRG
ncbi:malonyl-CoA-[acyl-carrier-protein] transacylase [Sterolibacterium denitrificans]|uniref:Malonyl CoA-acyl carrier protein transacylase n=1 Tax=Sterolibacterium denitrificans TaxID=157592 RepID=A0A7Z7HRW1_9PROT|nr:ACP S-malonyltransferase [Sterolibacterium denitrificans]SMB26640.1 malonyl-CoA-[acyl-carrier-protein] transacylase [Sterolibacterium denitrificans]